MPARVGLNELPELTRLELFEHWLPQCDLLDLELRNLSRFSGLLQRAAATGKEVILSFHDFMKTPSLEELSRNALDRCRPPAKTQIFKVATNVSRWSDVETLIRLV